MSFAEEVLKTVLVPLPDELTEFLFLLLVREEQSNFPTVEGKYAPENYVDIFAHTLNEYFGNIPNFSVVGFKFVSKDIQYQYTPDISQNLNTSFWADLRSFKVPYQFPNSVRREHSYIIGKTGSGKSTLLHQLISYDAQQGVSDRKSVV